jgi:hypothetical protein
MLRQSKEYHCLSVLDKNNPNQYICLKCGKKHSIEKQKNRWNKLLKIGTAMIITLLISLTPVNKDTLDSQEEMIQTLKNYATITKLILEIYNQFKN